MMSSGKSRLDVALVERGLIESREKAQRTIMAAQVLVNDQLVIKASATVGKEDRIAVRGREKFVGRGGLKLEKALQTFSINPAGRVCIDIGASTGGFTDCLLQQGASKVYAVDVGHGQLDWRLRQDSRVVVHEGVNARFLSTSDFDPRPSLAVADVSFISLTLILLPIFELLNGSGDMIVLIKPQFELSRSEVGRGGIVREEGLRMRAVEKIRAFVEQQGHRWLDFCTSPIKGRDGNIEFLAHIKP